MCEWYKSSIQGCASKFVGMTVNLSLITLDNTDTETISAFRFRLYWLFSCLCFTMQEAGSYAISRQNNLELHLGCHTCLLGSFTLVCLWCRRTGGRAYGHVITKFSRMGGFLYFLTHGAPMRELRYNQLSFFREFKKFFPYCWCFTTQASSTFFAFVILLLEPLRSFFFDIF